MVIEQLETRRFRPGLLALAILYPTALGLILSGCCHYLVPQSSSLTELAAPSTIPERCSDPAIARDTADIQALGYRLFKHSAGASCGYLDRPYATLGLEVHAGIDFEQPLGTAIYAVTAGYVEHVSNLTGQIAVRLADSRLVNYFHLETTAVQSNTHLTRGQFLGTVGMKGLASKPHLHLEVRVHYPGKAGLAGISCAGYCPATEIMHMTQNPVTLLNLP